MTFHRLLATFRWLLLILVSDAITGLRTETPVLAPGLWAAGILEIVYSEFHSRQNGNHFDCGSDEYLSRGLCCKLCSPGEFARQPCTVPHTRGICERCDPGMFTDAGNGLDSCRACSSCDKNQEMVSNCSATSDRKCQCRIGHFYADPQSPEFCLPCSK
ncbi:Tumor necrosis factor receptor superfamily member 22 [Microtus ochrogaster]|uniref:Tumor necrosis factor receptor superfamily member 22 n=1 Tax=Microtus ochrogaster TaxID=79684 RepID=A0A8J6GCM7_MICOH|nr:Tumor necrosis factor receptor superfamily member 22 [Microtus ochrogaster]